MNWETPTPQIRDIRAQKQRTKVELAVENMVEGCVNETYSALQALYQSSVLKDPKLRAIFRQIATDETEHAELAQDIHSWLQTLLTQEEQAQVEQARTEALQGLIAYHQEASRNETLEQIGLPNPAVAEKLATELAKLVA